MREKKKKHAFKNEEEEEISKNSFIQAVWYTSCNSMNNTLMCYCYKHDSLKEAKTYYKTKNFTKPVWV